MSRQDVVCGDAVSLARDFQPTQPTVVITDPIWPNRGEKFFPGVDAFKLLHDTLCNLIGKVSHVVVQVGCATDPRFLRAVPDHWEFWRTCWLAYHVPSKRGTVLVGSDVAYVFGRERYPEGTRVVPGSTIDGGRMGRGHNGHPCPRSLGHVRWLVRWFSLPGELVLDPFCGSGTTLRAAKDHHRDALGWDIDPDFCALTRQTLAQEMLL